ncbi:TniB family NTP-binding protein [Methylobacterium sp. 13MFTsu3.1M2]|uniref:TniB family NTP-binding protein n=1 Tax=Methylobacterium sp. 13MFTsu3.1M2 TaxID=1502776 RepID=UPI0008E02C85|nr:TniB family NTP-binding protein [Methylobacterium sp. 13MFTsu3.1M2]SFD82590.1 AAA domain-containing protein [Methylobacterium sp. 13MFTsu3.1M2]
MIEAVPVGIEALQDLLSIMSPEERERLEIMERVKGRILRTADRDTKIAELFRKLLADLVTRIDPARPLGPGNRSQTRALVVTGMTGAGKSSILARVIGSHPGFPGYGVPRSDCRAVSVLTPSPCNPKALGLEILRVLNYPMASERSVQAVWAKVRERLEFLGKLVLHLDEIHNVLETANKRELVQIRTLLKTFLVTQTWPVVLILSGLPEVVSFFEGLNDPDDDGAPTADTKSEVRRRAVFMHLRSLDLPADIPMVSAAIEDTAQAASMIVDKESLAIIAPRLIHASLHELGTTMQLVHEAIGQGLDARPRATRLGVEQFKLAYRERTGCADAVNPFFAADWRKIDCRLVLKQSRDAAEAGRLGRPS